MFNGLALPWFDMLCIMSEPELVVFAGSAAEAARVKVFLPDRSLALAEKLMTVRPTWTALL